MTSFGLYRIQCRFFTKYRMIRYRRVYADNKVEPKKTPKTRKKMFVPTHIAHKYDWSPVDRIWAMRDSKYDSVDQASFTALMKETVSSIELLDVVGLSLRKPTRQIDWKPHHACVAMHHLAQIHDGSTAIDDNRYLFDLLEECAVAVAVLKPRWITQTMWSLHKLKLTQTRAGLLCLQQCANALDQCAFLHKMEVWQLSDAVNVLTQNAMYTHPVLTKLAQRVINLHRDNEQFQINDIPQSYAILARCFGEIICAYRDADIEYDALCAALLHRFMDDKMYETANDLEILQFVQGVQRIMGELPNECKFMATPAMKKLEGDFYGNIQSMHMSDIAAITKALCGLYQARVIANHESVWMAHVLQHYLPDCLRKDAFSLLEPDEAVEYLHDFISVLCTCAGAGNDNHKELLAQYMQEMCRMIELFNDTLSKVEKSEIFQYETHARIMSHFIAVFDTLSSSSSRTTKDAKFFLFEQKFLEILCSFLETQTSLFSGHAEWRKLLTLPSCVQLVSVLLRQTHDISQLNMNALQSVFQALTYHILGQAQQHSDAIRVLLEKDMASSRQLINALYQIIALFSVVDNNAGVDGDTPPLVSPELKAFVLKLAHFEYNQKYHLLSQYDRKLVTRTVLVLQDFSATGNEDKSQETTIEHLLSDINRFSYYIGSKAAMLTQVVNDKTELNGRMVAQQLQTDRFQRWLKQHQLFVSKAFTIDGADNVFQIKHLNEWRFERVCDNKRTRLFELCEDGNTKGQYFEWRFDAPHGCGIHPTLNDVDLETLDEDERQEIFRRYAPFDEDRALLTKDANVDYRKIILRSVCDVLLESNDKSQCIAVFVNTDRKQLKNAQLYFKYLCNLFHVKCIVIDNANELNDIDAMCKNIESVL